MSIPSIIRQSVFVCSLTLLYAIPSWAVPVPVNITANSSNPLWNQVHDNAYGPGAAIYTPLVGTLMGELDYWYGGWRLTNIMGTLTDSYGANQGTINISNGWLHDGPSEYAHGYFEYSISNGTKDGTSGTFSFSKYENSNYLTDTSLRLWGGDTTNSIGMDFKAYIAPKPDPIPEPATILLLGSGLVGLMGWRFYKKAHA